jgi:hypothetical protein
MNSNLGGAVKKFPEFFDVDGLLHHEFAPPGQRDCYCAAVQRNRRDKWLLHRATQRLLRHHPITGFPSFRSERIFGCSLKGSCFATVGDINSNMTAELPKTPEESFRRCFQNNGRFEGAMFVCPRAALWRWSVRAAVCPTVTVKYHHLGNFLTAHRMFP